jgi:hypothetical protein
LDPSGLQNSSNKVPKQPLLPRLPLPLLPQPNLPQPLLLHLHLPSLSVLLQLHPVAQLPSNRLLLLVNNNSNTINSSVAQAAETLVPSSLSLLLCLKELDLTPNLWLLHSYYHLEPLLPTPRLICSTTLPSLLSNTLPVALAKLPDNILGSIMELLLKVETCLQVLVALSLQYPACLSLRLPLR